jgi:membrane protein implicated in regulation of membrane protease activity
VLDGITFALVLVTAYFMWSQARIAKRSAEVELFLKIQEKYETRTTLLTSKEFLVSYAGTFWQHARITH